MWNGRVTIAFETLQVVALLPYDQQWPSEMYYQDKLKLHERGAKTLNTSLLITISHVT